MIKTCKNRYHKIDDIICEANQYGLKKPIKPVVMRLEVSKEFKDLMEYKMREFCIKTKRRTSQSLFETITKIEITRLIKESLNQM